MTRTEVQQTLERIGLRPSKALGQNFLIDGNILGMIIAQGDLREDDVVLEIGAGLGVLTRELLPRAQRVIGIEKDTRLCAYLREALPGLELIEGDAVAVLGSSYCSARVSDPAGESTDRSLASDQETFGQRTVRGQRPAHNSLHNLGGLKVVANLPYSISTPILERLVEGHLNPQTIVVLLQREVADRLTARPRTKAYGALTLYTRLRYHPTLVHVVSSRCFYPRPHVESAIVLLERRDPRTVLKNDGLFHDLVRTGFSQRRKMLRKLLAEHGKIDPILISVGADPRARAEELDLDQWIKLTNALG